MHAFKTLAEALDTAARGDREIGFIDGANDERRLSYKLLRKAALRDLAVLQADGARPGEPLILFLADNLHFIRFFWAALYGGLVPVPVATGATDAHVEKLLKIWSHLGEPRIVTDARHAERARAHLEKAGNAEAGRRLSERIISDQPPGAPHPARCCECALSEPAVIQFSSGATGEPKGVVLTHANVLANIEAISAGSHFAEDEVGLSWMPLSHDMGLIGFHLALVCHGFKHYLMATDLFARRPRLWLKKAAEKRATLLCSPNFGYRHTLRAVAARGLPDIDLSAVRLLYNGAEPIAAPLAREFLATLAPAGLQREALFPVYGLAEATLAVTFPPAGSGLRSLRVAGGKLGIGDRVRFAQGPQAIELVCLGAPVAHTELRIAGAHGQPLGDDTVGRIWIRGASVTAGYHQNAVANKAARMGAGWLDTGDLGFMHEGELWVTGRAKEVIFVNGQNHYPQDLETVAGNAAGVDCNKVAAAGARSPDSQSDELVLFVVFRGTIEDFVPIARAVAAGVNQHTGLAVARVVPIRRMPKTTSGKLQRMGLAWDYAAGAFAGVNGRLDALLAEQTAAADKKASSVVETLAAICHDVAPDKHIGPGDDLFEAGLSSLDLAQIHEGIEERWPDRLEITDLFEYPTLDALAAYLAARQPA
jgi:acyl-CoA synthetase (AMP-forming)/AMP-acid ligase II/acyl carrier protein